MARLRSLYFAQAGEAALRYGVTFDRIIAHLWRARRSNPHLLLRSVLHVEDLVHAVACIDNCGLAWADLAARYERALIRRCRAGLDEIEATIFVRRVFANLRRRRIESPAARTPALSGYTGVKPLRNWLADRLSAGRAGARPDADGFAATAQAFDTARHS